MEDIFFSFGLIELLQEGEDENQKWKKKTKQNKVLC